MPKHTVASHYSYRWKVMTQERIDWTSLGREIGRVPRMCADKWERMQAAQDNRAVAEGTAELARFEYAATACSSSSSSSTSSSSPSSSSSSRGSSSDDESSSGSDSDGDSDSDESTGSSNSSESSTLSKVHSVPASSSGGSNEDGTGISSAASNSVRIHWTKEKVQSDLLFGIQCLTLTLLRTYLYCL